MTRLGVRAVLLRAAVFVTLGLSLGSLATWSACAQGQGDDQGPDARVTRLPDPGPALGKDLMLSLALAKNLHHKADVYLKEGRVADAVASVKQILAIQFPPDSPEGEEVVLDARARLAKLLISEDKLDQATKVIDDGLAGVSRQSFFLANLYTVRGEVLEARAATEEHDPAGARAARRQAIEAYDKAITIDKALLDQISQGDQGGAP